MVLLSGKRIVFLEQRRVSSQPTPNHCPRLVGVTRDGNALLVCRTGDRNVLSTFGRDGRMVPIQTPNSIDAWGVALTPDGSILVAPLRDSDDWPRRVFGVILGRSEGFVFDPALLDELVTMTWSDEFSRINKLPRIERFLFSTDGNKLFAEVALSAIESSYFSVGGLDRLAIPLTRAHVGLALNTTEGLPMFSYSSASGE